jgi:hypothetical protein
MKNRVMMAASAASMAAIIMMAASGPAEARWGWGGYGTTRVVTIIADDAERQRDYRKHNLKVLTISRLRPPFIVPRAQPRSDAENL